MSPAASGSAATPTPGLPRELVLASAGTGKTFRISSRIVGLLELGADPDDVFASTFTRKAAGEILDRVLERLARASLDDDAAAELAGHALLRDGGTAAGTAHWQALLARLVARLHRINVGTLDAFFVRAAGSFALELGLPPTWRIGDEPTSTRLESEALEDVLASARRDETLELIRALLGGDATRSVHHRVLERARELRRLLHQLEPAADEPFEPFDAPPAGTPSGGERADAADRVEALDVPTTKSGNPDSRWSAALSDAARAVRDGDWDALVGAGLGAKVLDGDTTYYRKEITPETESALREALELAGRAFRAEHARRAPALGTLARRFDDALARRQHREGAYRFSDVTRMVGGVDPLGARADLWYRLDQRARHLLLDEFQDTSLPQWEALMPLAEELLSGHAEERAAVIVADPKQSIYGWRGAEPELVHRVRRRFPLDEDRLRRSYRSSEVVLDFVNRVFADLDGLSLWDGADADRELVRTWLDDFEPHEAALELPGRVRVEAGPREDSMASDDRPRMMRRAAERVADIRRRAPGCTVGVLLRKNRNVPLLMAELRARGIEASEEGGTRLTDSPAVAAILALLRLADHPGHSIARYHVANTPAAELPGIDLASHEDEAGARRVSAAVRRRLLRDGYGPVLDAWTRELGRRNALGERDLRRLFQLVELGFRWDESGATLRPADFVRFVESEKVEDPAAVGVRVMTVHQAKGLEFDVVVLPELDLGLTGGGRGAPAALPERDPDTGRIVRVFPYVKSAVRPLLPEVTTAAVQARDAELRDALGVLYVGMTRARFALHLLVAADGKRGPSDSATFARLVRESIGARDEAAADGDVLFEDGDPGWPDRVPSEHRRDPADADAPEPVRLEATLAERARRHRVLAHRAPSDLEGGGEVRLPELLSLDAEDTRSAARRRGVVVHDWCRSVGWIEDGVPDDELLKARARRVAPEVSDDTLRQLLADFRDWLEAPPIRRALSRKESPDGARLERERPFAVRLGDEIVEGVIDRLVLVPGPDGSVETARILDFKSDRVGPEGSADGLVERYRPQLDAYRRATARRERIPAGAVEAALVFLRAGEVREV